MRKNEQITCTAQIKKREIRQMRENGGKEVVEGRTEEKRTQNG
jgi:protein tyrosine phosphatase (PTP) superfamily phosphohydrolase (DUF442 family)